MHKRPKVFSFVSKEKNLFETTLYWIAKSKTYFFFKVRMLYFLIDLELRFHDCLDLLK